MKILNNHKKRAELGVSPFEGIILDHLSTDWYYGSKKALSEELFECDQTVRTAVKRLIKKGYIESSLLLLF